MTLSAQNITERVLLPIRIYSLFFPSSGQLRCPFTKLPSFLYKSHSRINSRWRSTFLESPRTDPDLPEALSSLWLRCPMVLCGMFSPLTAKWKRWPFLQWAKGSLCVVSFWPLCICFVSCNTFILAASSCQQRSSAISLGFLHLQQS